MKTFFEKVGEVWKIFNEKYYHKAIAFFVGFVFLLVIFLVTLTAYFENVGAERSAEKEVMALTALCQKVESEEANQAAESFKMILSDGDKTSTESFEALKNLNDIDGGYYLRVYTKSETNSKGILSGQITAKEVVVKTDIWGNSVHIYRFFIKAGVTSYLVISIACMIFIKVYVMKKEKEDEKGEEK